MENRYLESLPVFIGVYPIEAIIITTLVKTIPMKIMNRIEARVLRLNLYRPRMLTPLVVAIAGTSSKNIRRAIRTMLIIIPALTTPEVTPKVDVKYSIDIIELITDVEKAAKETKLLKICGG